MKRTYANMHAYQTVEFGKAMVHRFRHVDLDVAECQRRNVR